LLKQKEEQIKYELFNNNIRSYKLFSRNYTIENDNLNFNYYTKKIYPINSVSDIVEKNLLKGGYIKETNSVPSEYTSFTFMDIITVIFPHKDFKGIPDKGPWSQYFNFNNFEYDKLSMSYERYKPAPRGYVRHLPTVDQ
jgi:hypothetical protein